MNNHGSRIKEIGIYLIGGGSKPGVAVLEIICAGMVGYKRRGGEVLLGRLGYWLSVGGACSRGCWLVLGTPVGGSM